MNDEGEKIFVNRRGHKQATDISDEMAEFETHKHVKKAKKSTKKPRRKTARKPLKRWQRITITAIALLLVSGPILLGEALRFVYDNSSQTALSEVNSLVDSKVMVVQKSDTYSAQQLQEIADNLKITRDKTCDGGLADNAAAIYPRAKSAHDRCLEVRRKLANLTAPMQDIAGQLLYLEKLKPIVEAVVVGSEDQYAVFSSQQENWKKTSERLADLKPPTSFLDTHESLTKQSSAISDLWTKLSQAYDAKDSSAFQANESDLGRAYEDFRAHTAKYQVIIADTQSRASRAYIVLQ